FATAKLPVEILLRRSARSSPAGGAGGGRPSALRRLARQVAWHGLLRSRFARRLAAAPNLVVVPNDAAFPYDRLTDSLHRRGIPFLLLQEGIRFPLPAAEKGRPYGGGGALAVAAWGEASGEYFASLGVPAERIHLTGSPRFDAFDAEDWSPAARALRSQLGIAGPALLLVTNPIDDQGFCTTAEKLSLVARFLAGLAPLLSTNPLTLVIKLHAREKAADFESLARRAGVSGRTRIVADAPLPPLFVAVSAVVILASTVGLEALRAGKRLGVLEIPGFGFVHDYVSSGAAVGLGWDRPLPGQVEGLLRGDVDAAVRATSYLKRHLAVTDGATACVVRLIEELVEARRVG
ncbi:MAG: hypothetical protein ACRD0X_03390, partial [Thermoanaerobaculia bacterium]